MTGTNQRAELQAKIWRIDNDKLLVSIVKTSKSKVIK